VETHEKAAEEEKVEAEEEQGAVQQEEGKEEKQGQEEEEGQIDKEIQGEGGEGGEGGEVVREEPLETAKETVKVEVIDITTPEDEERTDPRPAPLCDAEPLPVSDPLSPDLPLAQPDPCSPDPPQLIPSSTSLPETVPLTKKRKPRGQSQAGEEEEEVLSPERSKKPKPSPERSKKPKLLSSKSFPLSPPRGQMPSPPPLSSSRSAPLSLLETMPLIYEDTPPSARAALLALLGRY
jgi:hypothetical protein